LSKFRFFHVRWFVNLFDTNPYFFNGIDASRFRAEEPEAIHEAVRVIRREHQRRPECLTFGSGQIAAAEDFLLHGTFPRHCILGYTNIDIASTGDVYSGCWAMKPMGNIRTRSMEAVLADEAYADRARRMLSRKCPQCTCGWMVNTLYDKL